MSDNSTLAKQKESYWYAVQVSNVQRETPRAVTITLETVASNIQFYFKSGQFLNLSFEVHGQQQIRCYSISSAPFEEKLQVTIQSISDGLVSNYVNSTLKVGDRLSTSLPVGDFVLKNTNRPILFLAAGSGITPIFSMLKDVLYNTKQPCYLVYFNKNISETIFRNEISSLCNIYSPRLHVMNWHSYVQGRFNFDMHQIPFFQEALLFAPDIYMCGPNGWMEGMQTALAAYRFNIGQIYTESFNAVGLAEQATEVETEAEQQYTLSVSSGGCHYTIQASSNELLLSALRRHNIPITSGCEMGKCGSCMARVSSGRIEMMREGFLTPAEVNEGYTLCCQSKPRSDCSIEI